MLQPIEGRFRRRALGSRVFRLAQEGTLYVIGLIFNDENLVYNLIVRVLDL